MENLYQSKSAKIYFDEAAAVIKIVWSGFVRFEEFKDVMENALNFFIEKNAIHWLIDQKERQAVSNEINNWVVNDFFKRLLDAATPITCVATIVSKDVFGRHTMKTQTTEIVKTYNERVVPFEYFDNEFDAMRWLAKHNP
jgi:hypothetical protein